MKMKMKNIIKTLGIILPLVTSTYVNATLINIDFSGAGGTLVDGTTYSLSGSYSAFGTTGVRLNNQSVTITFDRSVNLLFQSNSLDGSVWNNPADGVVMLDVDGGGMLSLVSDPDGEIDTILNDGTDSLGVSFKYNNISGNEGPHGNDYIASNQDWLFFGTTDSTFTISQLNALSSNTNSFEVLAEVGQVPAPAAAWLLGSGLIGLVGMRKKSEKYA